MIRGHFGSIHPVRIALGAHEGPVSDKQAGPSLGGPRTLPRRAHETLGSIKYYVFFLPLNYYYYDDYYYYSFLVMLLSGYRSKIMG